MESSGSRGGVVRVSSGLTNRLKKVGHQIIPSDGPALYSPKDGCTAHPNPKKCPKDRQGTGPKSWSRQQMAHPDTDLSPDKGKQKPNNGSATNPV